MIVQKASVAQEKPFACDVKGCEMTFTNKDHLDWHRKKHEMMLNLGLVNKNTANEVADQTPTPTRFIRNCEEVGLFQDLQNVNPFDEIFKKAVDLVKSGVTLGQENNSEDTLHTPHILPHITENQLKETTQISKIDSDCDTFIFSSGNKSSDSDSDSDTTIVVDDNDHQPPDLKQKIKETIQNRINRELYKSESEPSKNIILTPAQSIHNKVNPVKSVVSFQKIKNNQNATKENKLEHVDNKIEKTREMNRAAQNRCRKRKQQVWREMEEELVFLRQENKSLKQKLETIILQHSKCQIPNQGTIMTSIINADTSEPSPTTQITSPAPSQLPILLHIIPNTQLSLVPSGNTFQSELGQSAKDIIPPKQEIKQRSFRKIVPKIIIQKNNDKD